MFTENNFHFLENFKSNLTSGNWKRQASLLKIFAFFSHTPATAVAGGAATAVAGGKDISH
jgi:hypothetical protein